MTDLPPPLYSPRCHNAQVVSARTRRWFSLCWIPLIVRPRSIRPLLLSTLRERTSPLTRERNAADIVQKYLGLWYLSVAC